MHRRSGRPAPAAGHARGCADRHFVAYRHARADSHPDAHRHVDTCANCYPDTHRHAHACDARRHARPTATASPRTATPLPGVRSKPDATMSPGPTPLPVEPHGIEFTPITRGEPQRLPVSIALYYRVTECYACGHGFGDLRRIGFDEVAGTYREDRLEAFFDNKGLVNSARISRDGQQIAFMVCHRGHYCGGEYAEYFPTPDAEQSLWISGNAGRTWKLLDPVLPGSVIVDMRDGDVLVEERNYWSERHRRWSELSDEAWEAVLARLGGLGYSTTRRAGEAFSLDRLGEGAAAGIRAETPDGGRPGLDARWRHADGAIMWAAEARKEHLLAITDERGSVRRVYGAEEWRWGPDPNGDPRRIPAAATDDLLVRPSWTSRPLASGHQRIEATAELIDLATATIREVEGLTLPGAVGPRPDPARNEYYHFWAARPAPDRPYR